MCHIAGKNVDPLTPWGTEFASLASERRALLSIVVAM